MIADNYIEGYHIPIAHPGLMRMLDYKRYDVEVNEHYVWFEAPMRSKPSSNRLERLYADLVTPMPGLGPEDLRVWRYVFLYPNTTIDLYPDQVNTWQMVPHGVDRTRDVFARFARPTRAREPAWSNGSTRSSTTSSSTRTSTSSTTCSRALQTRGYECGPLSRREDAVAWFADRVRADLAPVLGADA